MTEITITEALAELKTIDNRIGKKQGFVQNYLYRQDQFKDPLAADGGTAEILRRERQAIADLENRKVRIRTAINDANNLVMLTVSNISMSLAEWLIWKRDVAPGRQAFLQSISNKLNAVRQDAMRKGVAVVSQNDAANSLNDVIVNINERELAKELEDLEVIL